MKEGIVEIFSDQLNEVLTETSILFEKWDVLAREQRAPKALAAISQMAELVQDADDVCTYLQEAYPPIRLTADENWRTRLKNVGDILQKVIGSQSLNGGVEENALPIRLHAIAPSPLDYQQLFDTMAQIAGMEDLLLTTLASAFSYLHGMLMTLRATLDADRTEALAILYAHADARYQQENWKEGENGGEWDKFMHHFKRTKFPWGKPSIEQLQNYYKELAENFSKTSLGQIYIESEDDPQVLGLAIANTNCTALDLSTYFRDLFRLREVEKLIEQSQSVSSSKSSKNRNKKSREQMTFCKKNILDGHLSLLYNKLLKANWIDCIEEDFKDLFSGKNSVYTITWQGRFGKSTLEYLFSRMIENQLISIPRGFTLSAILEGHFKDKEGYYLTGLGKGDAPAPKAESFIDECIQLMKTNPNDMDANEIAELLNGGTYDRYDQQNLHLHRR
ncbi:MAG: hypothetical protein KBT27_15000 [Prevotellaceae bacterium]|nr:hypothetical protein [Candidatus Faecinaster equi]